MKTLIQYLDPATAEKQFSNFELLAPALFRNPGFMGEYLRQPGMQSANITTGEVVYTIAFRVTSDKGFWLEVVKSDGGKAPIHLMPMVNELAKKLGCKYIRGSTSKLGVVKLMEQCGFVPEAILMTKEVI